LIFELHLIRVGWLPSAVHAVFNIYRPEWMSTVGAFTAELADVIATFCAECTDNIVVCRDTKCPGVDGLYVDIELAAMFDSFGMSQNVQSTTRGDSLLNVLASCHPAAITAVTVVESDELSDHRLIFAQLAIRRAKLKTS
jgi:hypothetical protein